MNLATKGAFGFVVIWAIAGIAIFAARSSRPTHESVLAFIQKTDLSGKSEAQVDAMIVTLADKLDGMSAGERRLVENSDSLRSAFRTFTAPQQRKFLDLTLPSGMKQTMLALNRMAPAERDTFVQNALRQAGQDLGFNDGTVDKATLDKVLQDGMAAFYSTASPEVKLQMAPVLEQLHSSLQNL